MARVLYGVMGNTYGHTSRTLSIISQLPEHEFYIIGGGRVPEVFAKEYPVLTVPVLRTKHRRQSLSLGASIGQIWGRVTEIPAVQREIRGLIERWQPDMAICDREFFLPIAARAAGLPCISIDHSHVLKACHYPVPSSARVAWSLAMLNDYLLFDFTRHNLIVSFFHPPLRQRARGMNELLPPVLRPTVTEISPSQGGHVLVYQSVPQFEQLLPVLRQLARPVVLYGARNELAVEQNITFKPFDRRRILEDLASCAYAVVNGGHNLICEALYYRKPVLCFPIRGLFEQFINVWHVRQLGYGDFAGVPTAEVFKQFESRLDEFRRAIDPAFMNGTMKVVRRVREVIARYTDSNAAHAARAT